MKDEDFVIQVTTLPGQNVDMMVTDTKGHHFVNRL